MHIIGTGSRMAMTANIPEGIATPDRVDTRIGTLEFFDGFPTDETVPKAYDKLDFMRGVRVFLSTIPAASLVAMRAGIRSTRMHERSVRHLEASSGLP